MPLEGNQCNGCWHWCFAIKTVGLFDYPFPTVVDCPETLRTQCSLSESAASGSSGLSGTDNLRCSLSTSGIAQTALSYELNVTGVSLAYQWPRNDWLTDSLIYWLDKTDRAIVCCINKTNMCWCHYTRIAKPKRKDIMVMCTVNYWPILIEFWGECVTLIPLLQTHFSLTLLIDLWTSGTWQSSKLKYCSLSALVIFLGNS